MSVGSVLSKGVWLCIKVHEPCHGYFATAYNTVIGPAICGRIHDQAAVRRHVGSIVLEGQEISQDLQSYLSWLLNAGRQCVIELCTLCAGCMLCAAS